MAERLNTELVVRLLANNRDFVSGMAQAVREVNRFQGEIDRSSRAMEGLKKAAGMAVAGFGILSAAAGGFVAKSTMVAARVEEMDGVLAQMGRTAGLAKAEIDEQVESIKDMGITTGVAQQVATQFIQSQLDFTKAARLARVAQDAAVLSQSNSSETLSRLIVAIQRYDTLMLRTLGLNINVSGSQEALAASLGKTAKELTEAEKQQAVLNAVLEEGKTITGAYETAMGSARKQLGSFPRHIEDVEEAVGSAFVPVFFEGITALTKFVKAIKSTLEEGEPLREFLEEIGERAAKAIEALTPAIESIKNLDMGRLIDQFKGLGAALGTALPAVTAMAAALGAQGLGKALSIIPGLGAFGQILGGINPLVAGFAALVLASEEGRDALMDLVGVAKDLAAAFIPAATAIANAATVIVTEVVPPFMGLAAALVQSIVPAVSALAVTFGGLVQGVMAVVGPLLQLVGVLAELTAAVAENQLAMMALQAVFLGFAFSKVAAGFMAVTTAVKGLVIPLQAVAATKGITTLAATAGVAKASLTGLTGAVVGLNPALLAVGLAGAGVVKLFMDARSTAAKAAEDVRTLTTSLEELDATTEQLKDPETLGGFQESVMGLARERAIPIMAEEAGIALDSIKQAMLSTADSVEFLDDNIHKIGGRLGDIDRLAAAAEKAGLAHDPLVQGFIKAGREGKVTSAALIELANNIDHVTDRIEESTAAFQVQAMHNSLANKWIQRLADELNITKREAKEFAETIGVDLVDNFAEASHEVREYVRSGAALAAQIKNAKDPATEFAKVLGVDVAQALSIAEQAGWRLSEMTARQAEILTLTQQRADRLGISWMEAARSMHLFDKAVEDTSNALEEAKKKADAVVAAFGRVISAGFRARDAQRANADATQELAQALATAEAGFLDSASATRMVEDAAAAQTQAIFDEVMALVEAGHIARNYADIKGEMLRRINEVEAALPGMVDEVLSSARALDLARMATDQFSQAFADTVGIILSAEDATFAVEEKMRALGETFKELERQRGLKSAQEQLADARKELAEITKALNDFAGTQEDIDNFLENKGFRAVTETEKALKDLLVAQQIQKSGGKSKEDLLEAQKKAQERVVTATENVSDAQDDLNRLKDVAESQTRDLVRAIEREAIALVEAGRLGRDQNSILEFMKGRLRDVGIEYPKVKTQIDRYVEAISKIPEKKPTKVKINGMALVKAQLNELQWLIGLVPKHIQITTGVDQTGARSGLNALDQELAKERQIAIDTQVNMDGISGFFNSVLGVIELFEKGIIKPGQTVDLSGPTGADALEALLGSGLAKGAMVTKPTVALIGEAGPELVLPLSDPGRTAELLAAAGLNQSSASMVHVTVTLDGKVVAETIVDPVVDSIYERERAMS